MFKSHNIFLLGLLFLMGTHAVFLYPVKYTILFNYMEDRNKAITYLHINLILSATIGNILASIIISLAKNQYVLLDVLLIMSCVGIFFAYLLPPVVFQVKEKISYSINPLYDMLLTYKKIRYADSSIVKIITKISANWMFCIMFITQLPVITKNYLHGDSSVFSLLLCAFIIAIAIGMVLTSRIVVNKAKSLSMITLYKFIMVAFSIAFMCSNFNQGLSHLGFVTFISNYYSLASIIWIMLIGFYSGVYAVYLYNQLLQRASDTLYNLSTSLIAGLSTLFIIIISLLFIFGLKFISIWYIMLIFIIFFTIL